jgi:predicted DNA-binding transcriptional regulator AlpA
MECTVPGSEERRARPTLDEIRQWPATSSVEDLAAAVGISRSGAYAAINAGTLPVRTLRVGGRIVVVTESILAILGATAA